jgi:hypothetical protein
VGVKSFVGGAQVESQVCNISRGLNGRDNAARAVMQPAASRTGERPAIAVVTVAFRTASRTTHTAIRSSAGNMRKIAEAMLAACDQADRLAKELDER